MKVLLIGPKYNKRDSRQVGGIVVLFENLIEYFNDNKLTYNAIDTNKANYGSPFTAYIAIITQLLFKIWGCNVVMLNGTFKDYRYIGPIVRFLCRISRKPYVLRKFAGNFNKLFATLSYRNKKQMLALLNDAAICYWETKELVDWGKQFNKNSLWFPNIRKRPDINFVDPLQRKSTLVFMSHVKKEKGVSEMLEAYKYFSEDYNLEIYGTLMDYTEEQLQGKYKGVVAPNDVAKTLSPMLLLLLSSWNEGYPGIIIEAFAVGLPVLASRAGGIPEMINNGYNGILVDPKDPQSIIDGIKRFQELDYNRLCRNALASFDSYDSDLVNARIIETLKKL